MKKQPFVWGLKEYLETLQQPVLTDLQLLSIVRYLLEKQAYGGQPLDIRQSTPTLENIKKRINRTSHLRVSPIKIDSDFRSVRFPYRVWRNQSSGPGSAQQVACIIDPLCYVSHLSAMRSYGLTSRNPLELFLTVPNNDVWRANAKIETIEEGKGVETLLREPHISIPKSLRRQSVRTVIKKTLSANSILQSDEYTRVVPIGYCFLDMVTEPHLCGGMSHVIEVFSEHANVFKHEIIETAEEDTRPIAKVRIGYLLDEVVGIKHNLVESWVQYAQRGSSRVLDPTKPFNGNTFSEKWMLSINV